MCFLIDLTKEQKSRMFISPCLYDDLRRTIIGTVEFCNKHVTGTDLELDLRMMNQDNGEKLFGKLRNFAGNNRNMTIAHVDAGMSEYRAKKFVEAGLCMNT